MPKGPLKAQSIKLLRRKKFVRPKSGAKNFLTALEINEFNPYT